MFSKEEMSCKEEGKIEDGILVCGMLTNCIFCGFLSLLLEMLLPGPWY